MEFFNKKEEVLDVQLTEYGKYLLSQGRMKPVFYAFYDDEILYDLSASGDLSEIQKNADRRIRYETPNLKPQTNTTGVETRVRQFQKAVETNINKKALSVNSIDFADAYENVPHFSQKFFVATDPLGTSDLKSQYAPAWEINCLHGEITSSTDYYTVNLTSSAAGLNNGVIKEIPQLNITMDYKLFYTRETESTREYTILAPVNARGINLAVQNNFILLDIQEHNTNDDKENYYCEVYLSGSDEGLEQLCFGGIALVEDPDDQTGTGTGHAGGPPPNTGPGPHRIPDPNIPPPPPPPDCVETTTVNCLIELGPSIWDDITGSIGGDIPGIIGGDIFDETTRIRFEIDIYEDGRVTPAEDEEACED